MKSSIKKLVVSAGFLVISLSLVVSVSYAWVTMSSAPAVSGIAMSIGGSATIQIAPDISVEQEGKILHYPGKFEETLNLSADSTYAWLGELAGLKPVSTADGLHWFTPDVWVDERLRTLKDYELDDTLALANLKEGDISDKSGHYIYLDFWVVAPMDNCRLRVSTGTDGQGSYVIGLPTVEASGDTVNLTNGVNEAANSVRIGFLANADTIIDDSMTAYVSSEGYDDRYTKLRGLYQEPGIRGGNFTEGSRFTIYEPNGNVHTGVGVSYVQTAFGSGIAQATDGMYHVTQPIAYIDGLPALGDVSEKLFVQKQNTWLASANGGILLNEIFKGYLLSNAEDDKTKEELLEDFFMEGLQGEFSPYLTPGAFYGSTQELYNFGECDTSKDTTAVEDAVIVTLEKNIPQRLRMYVWLEGQDVDCVREAALDAFAMGLEFAGSTE